MRSITQRTRLDKSKICAVQCLAFAALALFAHTSYGQNSPPAGSNAPGNTTGATAPTSAAPTSAKDSSASGTTIQIKKGLTGDFTYRFVTARDQSSAPAPLPSAASANASIPVSLPASIPASAAILEVVDKTRGNVARIPLSSGTSVTLTEASFTYVQTVFITVQHDAKPVTDVLITIADASHKFSMAWPLKKSDLGVAQFGNVPMGVPITVGVNGAGHPVLTQTNTLTPDHPADGYHWPNIVVDWSDVATVNVQSAPVGPTSQPVPGAVEHQASDSGSTDRQHNEERGGGGPFSSVLNTLFSLAIVALVIYAAIWAFNKGHVKTLLDKAGVNTADLTTGNAQQPSPFDKPAKAPISPITEGTADPFGGSGGAIGAAPVPVPSGPRLVATAGAYSGTIFALTGAYSEIGRDAGNTVPMPNDTNASRRHATISVSGTEYSVTDNGSSNGTFLNGVRVPPNSPQPLRSGDELQVGMTRFRFEA